MKHLVPSLVCTAAGQKHMALPLAVGKRWSSQHDLLQLLLHPPLQLLRAQGCGLAELEMMEWVPGLGSVSACALSGTFPMSKWTNSWIITKKTLNADQVNIRMLSVKVRAVPKCRCDCIGHRSTALHVSLCGLRDEPQGSQSPYSHGYSGGTWMACLCCVGDDETVKNR